MTPFPNHILKFQRGRHHLNDLRSLTERWFNGNHHSARFEVNPTDAGELLIRASVDPIPTDPFSLVISDVIQNFRGCLEHLAYALTAAFTKPLPEDVARDSQFPIIGDVDRKGNTGQGATLFQSQSKCVRGMHPAAQLVIEGVQPYHRGNAFRNEPLWKLGALSNTDKHRTFTSPRRIPSSLQSTLIRLAPERWSIPTPSAKRFAPLVQALNATR